MPYLASSEVSFRLRAAVFGADLARRRCTTCPDLAGRGGVLAGGVLADGDVERVAADGPVPGRGRDGDRLPRHLRLLRVLVLAGQVVRLHLVLADDEDAVVRHPGDVQVVGVLGHPPQHLAGAQVEALQLARVVGGEDHAAVADDRAGRAPPVVGELLRDLRLTGVRVEPAGRGRFQRAVGVRPQQAAGHDVHGDDDAGVGRADDDALAGGEDRALVAADGVGRHGAVRLAELLAPQEGRLPRLAGHLNEDSSGRGTAGGCTRPVR